MTFKHTYKEMLEKAYKELPEISSSTKRFEIPTLHGRTQGNRTIINNLSQVAKYLNRPEDHIIKFFLRELATTGTPEDSNYSFIGKFSGNFLNTKLNKYVKEFVLCEQCGKPDTFLKTEEGSTFKQCEACGARQSIRKLK